MKSHLAFFASEFKKCICLCQSYPKSNYVFRPPFSAHQDEPYVTRVDYCTTTGLMPPLNICQSSWKKDSCSFWHGALEGNLSLGRDFFTWNVKSQLKANANSVISNYLLFISEVLRRIRRRRKCLGEKLVLTWKTAISISLSFIRNKERVFKYATLLS